MGLLAPAWDALGWHHQRMYMEMMVEDAENEAAENGEGTTRVDAAGDISGMGFNVVQVDFGQGQAS